MKILIVDKFESWGVDQLKRLADEVIVETGLKDQALADRVASSDADVIVVRSTKIPAKVLEAGKKLKLVVRAGSGVDNIDVAAASRLGILVSNCPGQNAAAVAELTIGLMIALDRHLAENVFDLRAHKWNKKEYAKNCLGLKGRTLGIIGAGKIGSEVARRAVAFDMNVLYFHMGRTRRLVDFPNCRRAEIDELLRQSDFVSVHVPGGEGTSHLLDAQRIAMMKPGACLINTSRGDVIDEAALAAALREKRIRAAGVDVYENEPPADGTTIDSPLCDLPNVYGTHHIGASTDQAQMAVAEETVRIVAEYQATGKAPNCINLQQRPSARWLMLVRMSNRPGSLAHIFRHLAEVGVNVEEMDHVIYDGGRAACAHIHLDKHPGDVAIKSISTHENILGIELSQVEG